MDASARLLENLSFILSLYKQPCPNRMKPVKRKEERNGDPQGYIAMLHL